MNPQSFRHRTSAPCARAVFAREPLAKKSQALPRKDAKGRDVNWVRTSVLAKYCNPFKGCWIELERPLSLDEVEREVRCGVHKKLAAPFASMLDLVELPQQELRTMHGRKIAWFVLNGFQDAISVDVGVPALGYFPTWLVDDGNHRLAAAIARQHLYGEDPLLPLAISGSVDRAKELGLW